MSIGAEVAFLSECESCQRPTACMPGPRNQQARPAPINGYELGWEVEQRDRAFVICEPCLLHVIHAAA